MDYQQTHDYHLEDNEPPLDLKADFLKQEEEYLSKKPRNDDSPFQAFLRSTCHDDMLSTHDGLSTTQHTNTTLGTSSYGPSTRYDSDDESIYSIKASDIFEVNDSQRNHDVEAVDYALQITYDTISRFEEDREPALNASCPNFSEIPGTGDFVADSNLQNSMSSLNETFEKLNKCMERTSRSREIIRKLSRGKPVESLEKEDSQRCLIRLSSSFNRSNPSLLSGYDSSGSLSSMGNSSWKGPTNISFRTPSKAAKVSHNLKKHLQRDLNRVPVSSSRGGLVRRPHVSGV